MRLLQPPNFALQVSEIALEVESGLNNIINVVKQHDYNFMELWRTEDMLRFSTNRFKNVSLSEVKGFCQRQVTAPMSVPVLDKVKSVILLSN